MNEKPIGEAFMAIVELSLALGVSKINTLPGCWQHKIDEYWSVAVNGHQEEIALASDAAFPGAQGISVPPFHAYVEYNGWPAGLLDPYGGSIAGGSAANEDTLIAAVRAAMPQEGA